MQGKFIRKTLGLCFVESVESLNSKIWHTMIPPDVVISATTLPCFCLLFTITNALSLNHSIYQNIMIMRCS